MLNYCSKPRIAFRKLGVVLEAVTIITGQGAAYSANWVLVIFIV